MCVLVRLFMWFGLLVLIVEFVSMGNYAASGGYYIACAADKILASPNTITGSIGVFGLFFTAEDLLTNKMKVFSDQTVILASYHTKS